MKKLILIMFTIMFLMPFTSAFEFDNVGFYDEETKTITIKNAFGLPELLGGFTIATIKLDTPLVYNVIDIGNSVQLVAEFTITNNFNGYKKALKNMQFYDNNNFGSEINRIFIYRYKVGEDWILFNKESDLPEGTITIGIFTDVQQRDSIEWIPTMFGERITEWARWEEGLNLGLTGYWNFSSLLESSMNGTFHNITLETGLDVVPFLSGGALFGEASNFSSQSGVRNSLDIPAEVMNWTEHNTVGRNGSMVLWFNRSTALKSPNEILLCFKEAGAGVCDELTIWSDDNINLNIDNWATTQLSTSIGTNGIWHMVALTRNDTNGCFWFDNSLVGCDEPSGENVTGATNFNHFGENAGTGGYSGMLDEWSIWNRSLSLTEVGNLWNNGIGIQPATVIVTLTSPADAIKTLDSVLNFSATHITNSQDFNSFEFINTTLFVWDPQNEILQLNTTVITGITNQTNLSNQETPLSAAGTYNWNFFSCIDSGHCDFSSSNRTIIFEKFQEDTNFSASPVGEMTSQFFQENITTGGLVPIHAFLQYNGTNNAGTVTAISGNLYSLEDTITIARSPNNAQENRTYFFNFSLEAVEFNTTQRNQTVDPLKIAQCPGAGLSSVPYINITFFNETIAQQKTNATIVSDWTIWTNDQTINRTLSYTNLTENHVYDFCVTPNTTSVNVIVDLIYNNAESQQRSFSLTTVLTNLGVVQKLFLMPTSIGIFSPFRTTSTNGDTIANVKAVISRILGGVPIVAGTGFTDGSGFVSFFLNPDASYSAIFSKDGFGNNEFTFFPATDLRTVVMGSGVLPVANGTAIPRNTSYEIKPTNSTLQNNTIHTFSFDVTSSQEITLISMNITNKTGGQIGFQSNAGTGIISQSISTGNLSQIVGYYIIKTGGETLTVSRIWNVGFFFAGDYSIFRQSKLALDLEMRDFTRLLLVLIVIVGFMIFLSSNEILESSESKILVAMLLVWAFSIIGWLDSGIISTTADENIRNLARFSNQYGIAIVTTGFTLFFILRRLFIRRI